MRRLITGGIDVGSSAIKIAIVEDAGEGDAQVRGVALERIRRRDPRAVLRQALAEAIREAGLSGPGELAYLASTGEGDVAADVRDGHFYGMTAHARGALFLEPRARAVLDVGAMYSRAIVVDGRAKVLAYRMTSQCAAGTGQFVENIARYLGVRLDEVGPLSLGAPRAEPVSGICAVLAETDVINMVSRGISTAEVLRGVHESVALRLAKLLRTVRAGSPVLVTGGLAADTGLVTLLGRRLGEEGSGKVEILTHPRSAYAGAIGAALWGAFRHRRLGMSAPIPDDATVA
jgi:benzoyl-CoA reductase subunit D